MPMILCGDCRLFTRILCDDCGRHVRCAPIPSVRYLLDFMTLESAGVLSEYAIPFSPHFTSDYRPWTWHSPALALCQCLSFDNYYFNLVMMLLPLSPLLGHPLFIRPKPYGVPVRANLNCIGCDENTKRTNQEERDEGKSTMTK